MDTENAALSRYHYINVGKGGTFLPGKDPVFNSTPEETDLLFDHLRRKNQTKITLYFHGGLVPARNGMETARRIVHYITKDTDAHPVCFIWETGLTKTVLYNLDVVSRSEFFKKLLPKIIKVAGKKLGIEALDTVGNSKGVESMQESEIESELKKDVPFENYRVNVQSKSATVISAETAGSDVSAELQLKPEIEAEFEEEIESDPQLKALAAEEKPDEEKILMNSEYLAAPETDGKGILSSAQLIRASVQITLRIIKRHIQKRDHGFYPTAVEEILREIYVSDLGNWLWGSMKQKAQDMWKDNDVASSSQNWHVGSYFIKKLEEYNKEAESELKIDLVGHSAGSIVICELFKMLAAKNSSLKFRNIIFLAPACRCDLFDETVLSSPERYSSFRCFTMRDTLEKMDHLVEVLYPRSLLYLISGILEKESDAYILGLERHISGNKPYVGEMFTRVTNFLKPKGKMVYAKTDADAEEGFRSGSESHGGFDNDNETTLESMVQIIKQ